jgi:hypothetical protein
MFCIYTTSRAFSETAGLRFPRPTKILDFTDSRQYVRNDNASIQLVPRGVKSC